MRQILVERRARGHTGLLQLDDHQRQAVDEADQIRPAGVERARDAELADQQEGIVRWIPQRTSFKSLSYDQGRIRLLASETRHVKQDAMYAETQMRFVALFFKAALSPVLGLFLAAPESVAGDWPQFRGPNRDGNWNETGILESFPRKGVKIRWRHPVGGGFSSPVVAQGRVFVFDVELTKPTSRERLHCFEEKKGKVLWVYSYEEHNGERTYVPERGAGPTATPIVEGGRIYTVGANGYVHCLDVKTGKVFWEKNLWHEYTVEEMGCRPSPLIEGSLLIVFTGARPGATVLALDKLTGKEVWKALDEHVSNSSPIVITSSGRRQLIVWTDKSFASLDPANGRIFWRELMNTSNNDDVAAPVFWGNRKGVGSD